MWMTGQPIEIMAAHGSNESGLRHFSPLEKRENIVKTYLSWRSRLVLRGFQKAKTRTRTRYARGKMTSYYVKHGNSRSGAANLECSPLLVESRPSIQRPRPRTLEAW